MSSYHRVKTIYRIPVLTTSEQVQVRYDLFFKMLMNSWRNIVELRIGLCRCWKQKSSQDCGHRVNIYQNDSTGNGYNLHTEKKKNYIWKSESGNIWFTAELCLIVWNVEIQRINFFIAREKTYKNILLILTQPSKIIYFVFSELAAVYWMCLLAVKYVWFLSGKTDFFLPYFPLIL